MTIIQAKPQARIFPTKLSPNLLIVQSGQTIQAVINSITDAAADNLYTVMVPHGHEDENYILKSYVTVQTIESADDSSSLMAALNSGTSAAIQIISDSTANDVTDWPYLLGAWLAERYPNYTVLHSLWNDADGNHDGEYDAATILQTGADGIRYFRYTGVEKTILERGDFKGDDIVDLDIRMRVDGSWRPAATVTFTAWMGGDGLRSYYFIMTTAGNLRLSWTEDGTTMINKQASIAINAGITDPLWIRVTLDVNNGAGDAEVKFYTADDNVIESKSITTWTQLGTTQTVGATTSIYNGAGMDSRALEMGCYDGAQRYTGDIYALETYAEIDGVIPLHTLMLDSWNNVGTQVEVCGSPFLHILNGSRGGAGYSYMSNNATLAKQMMPNYNQCSTFIGIMLNESRAGKFFIDRVSAYKTTVAGLLPLSDINYIIQNPLNPAHDSSRGATLKRICNMSWAKANNCGVIDVYKLFAQGDLAIYISGDNLHPNAAGIQLYLNAIKAFLGSTATYEI